MVRTVSTRLNREQRREIRLLVALRRSVSTKALSAHYRRSESCVVDAAEGVQSRDIDLSRLCDHIRFLIHE